ncbi:MAG: ABC transporter ATP-binding protein [Promethearchaeota archaeon]
MPEVELVNITKIFRGNVTAVKDFSITIKEGEYVCLLGPSGCGKTTILRMIAGLEVPTHGEIYIDGENTINVPPEQRNIGYVFQNFAIFPNMTVAENVSFGSRVRGFSQEDIAKRTEYALNIVHMKSKRDYYPRQLSTPDLQRTGIARVLATGADLLLLDEPIGQLDLKIREEFQDELRRLVKELSLTAIHVTHDQTEAMAISDRIAVMRQGKFQQFGSSSDLYFHPQTIFVAHFIGESDFIEGFLRESNKEITRIGIRGGYTLQAKGSPPKEAYRDYRMILGIRREFMKLTSEKEVENTLPGNVLLDRLVGPLRRTIVRLETDQTVEIKRPKREGPLGERGKIFVYFDPDRLLMYPYPEEGLQKALSV